MTTIKFAWLPTFVSGLGYVWLKHYEQHEFTAYGEKWVLMFPITEEKV